MINICSGINHDHFTDCPFASWCIIDRKKASFTAFAPVPFVQINCAWEPFERASKSLVYPPHDPIRTSFVSSEIASIHAFSHHACHLSTTISYDVFNQCVEQNVCIASSVF